jgi:hypothetical protein
MATTEQKNIWIVGTVEKLANLGYYNDDDLEHTLDEYGIEVYWEIDEIRDIIYANNDELLYYLMIWYGDVLDETDLKNLYELVVTFRDNRKEVFSHGMQNLVNLK